MLNQIVPSVLSGRSVPYSATGDEIFFFGPDVLGYDLFLPLFIPFGCSRLKASWD